MKTRLLRKVRRKYEILEVINPKDTYERRMVLKGLRYKVRVCYILHEYYASKEDAMNCILSWVISDWGEIIKGSKARYEKVWHV